MSDLVFSHHPRKVGVMKQTPYGEAEAMIPDEEWAFDPTRVYEPSGEYVRGMKPAGFWLSVDDDWKRWCDEDSGWTVAAPHFFEVDMDRVLLISCAEELRAFTRKYAAADREFYRSNGMVYKIRWADVAEKYAGIVIAPYIWSMRLDMEASWYYSWDCASACIWDLSILTYKGQEVNDELDSASL